MSDRAADKLRRASHRLEQRPRAHLLHDDRELDNRAAATSAAASVSIIG